MTTWRRSTLVAAGCVLVATAACGQDPAPAPVMTAATDIELPPGVQLTPQGEVLETGEPGTTVLDLGNGASSAVTAVVRDVREGDLDDFSMFTLDESGKTSTPYYVDVSVRNEGPAGLGGVSLPLYLHSDADVLHPATGLVGDFEPCPASALPAQFLAGSSERVCFVYLVPKGQVAESVDLVPSRESDTLRWAVEAPDEPSD